MQVLNNTDSLRPAQVEFFASYLAFSNMGQGCDTCTIENDHAVTETLNAGTLRLPLRELRRAANQVQGVYRNMAENDRQWRDFQEEVDSWRKDLLRHYKTLRTLLAAYPDLAPIIKWMQEHIPCDLRYGLGLFTPAEQGGLAWLAERGQWVEVNISRRSAREFDLGIEGTARLNDKGETYRFSAWFPLACIREFWGMDLIECPYGDWSFLRDRSEQVTWADFEHIVKTRTPAQRRQPIEGYVVKLVEQGE